MSHEHWEQINLIYHAALEAGDEDCRFHSVIVKRDRPARENHNEFQIRMPPI